MSIRRGDGVGGTLVGTDDGSWELFGFLGRPLRLWFSFGLLWVN